MIERILAQITKARLIELAQGLIAIPSPTGDEGPIAEFVYQFLRTLGLEVHKIELETSGPTLVGYWRGRSDNPRFLLCGHLDTFRRSERWTKDLYRSPPEEHPDGTRLYGLGAHDMKGGLAAILVATEALVRSERTLEGTLVVALTTDEELWSRGIHALMQGGYLEGCVGCLIPEPTHPDIFRIGARGRHILTVDLLGSTVSAAYEQGGVNAITEAAKVIVRLVSEKLDLGRNSRFQKRGIISPVFIRAGEDLILVPERCTVKFDLHFASGQSIPILETQDRQALEEIGLEADYELRWDADREGITPAPPPYVEDDSLPFIQSALARMEAQEGFRRRLDLGDSVSDANHLSGKVPAPILGPAGGNTTQADEYVLAESMLAVARTYAGVVIDVLGPLE